MQRRVIMLIGLIGVSLTGGAWYLRANHGPAYYTGFVEGEERVIRSEVSGRVIEVRYAEGAAVPPNESIAALDDRDMQSRIKSKQEELAVVDAEVRTQTERIALTESTWTRDVSVRTAELHQTESAADLAERSFVREQALVKAGVSTAQALDDARARRDQSHSALERVREVLARTEAEERTIALARHELDTLRQKHDLTNAQLAELQVALSKYVIRSPAVPTVVQTQFIWPGELAQPGTAIVSVLDPTDKYVQIYVPVADVGTLHVGQHVDIELDSRPGQRVPGEVSFIADKANFTPEKIETRSDRMGQVYRVKVRVLEGVERFQPGTEGNVYVKHDA